MKVSQATRERGWMWVYEGTTGTRVYQNRPGHDPGLEGGEHYDVRIVT
jgi:hypothetical protein